MRYVKRVAAFALVVLFAASAFAQLTAQLTGTVTTAGTPVPGVTVTVSSPALQGTRTTVTGEAGGYQFSALPPGDYTVQFELSGMNTVSRAARLQLSTTARVDAELQPASVSDAITVTAAAPSVLETPQVATNLTLSEVDMLPVARNQVATAQLAAGVTGNTLSANQFQISGSPGYDNLVMVNGVVVTENIRSQSRPLYVEDAIQETTVLTGSISAEYGRFTGGVVNTITKSGGNEFSGSLRDSLTNPTWVAQTPAGESRLDKVNHVYEGTLGGYVLRDRLWFFTSARMAKNDAARQTIAIPASAISPASPRIDYNFALDEKRYEGKLTGNISSNHTLVGSYFWIDSATTNSAFQPEQYDLESLTNRNDPESLTSVHYNGILTSNLLIEGQYSNREQAFENNGSQYTDLIRGTLLLDRSNNNARFNSPTFCGVCDTETRNNNEYLLKANYFLSTKNVGTHNIVAGADRFEEQRYANNFQSGSNFRLFVNSARYSNGTIYPVITPTSSAGGNTYIRWTPIFEEAAESNLRTDSAFVNDKWDVTSRISLNLGVRYDRNDAVDGAGNVSSKDSRISPRLGAFYDVRGNGRHRISASYGEYVSHIVEGIASSNNTAGQPGSLDFAYKGPSFNVTGNDVPMQDVIRQVFEYFNGVQGGTANTAADNLRPSGSRAMPGYSAYFDGTLTSPNVREFSVGYGMLIGSTGFAKVDLISRDWHDFYVSDRDQSTRKATTPFGIPVDLSLIRNSDNIKREYRGVQVQGRWNPRPVQTGFTYTYSTLEGNDEGETANSGPVANIDPATRYPEFYNHARFLPMGYVRGDQRHKVRAWIGYDVPLPAAVGRLNVSLLQTFDSGLPYSAVALISNNWAGAPSRTALGYNSLTSGQYYFSDRGEYRTDDVTSTNLAFRYARNVALGLELFAQADVLNVLGEEGVADVTRVGTGVNTAANDASLQAFNPFTETPVLGQHYTLAANFGQPTSNLAYQTPRTYRFSLGLRF